MGVRYARSPNLRGLAAGIADYSIASPDSLPAANPPDFFPSATGSADSPAALPK
jgi:hypothetical protein